MLTLNKLTHIYFKSVQIRPASSCIRKLDDGDLNEYEFDFAIGLNRNYACDHFAPTSSNQF